MHSLKRSLGLIGPAVRYVCSLLWFESDLCGSRGSIMVGGLSPCVALQRCDEIVRTRTPVGTSLPTGAGTFWVTLHCFSSGISQFLWEDYYYKRNPLVPTQLSSLAGVPQSPPTIHHIPATRRQQSQWVPFRAAVCHLGPELLHASPVFFILFYFSHRSEAHCWSQSHYNHSVFL